MELAIALHGAGAARPSAPRIVPVFVGISRRPHADRAWKCGRNAG